MATNLTLRKGDAMQVRIEFTNQVDGTEYPMTDWSLEAQLNYGNCVPVECSCSWLDQILGVGLIELDSEFTSQLHTADYELRVRAISPTGKPTSADPVVVEVHD